MDRLILFGVSGLDRGRGGSGGLGVVVEEDGRRRHVQTSRSITFYDPAGHTITVTSQVRGLFRTNPATRAEAMQFIHGR